MFGVTKLYTIVVNGFDAKKSARDIRVLVVMGTKCTWKNVKQYATVAKEIYPIHTKRGMSMKNYMKSPS